MKTILLSIYHISHRNLAHAFIAAVFCIPLLAFSATSTGNGTCAAIASNGNAVLKVVISPTTTEAVRKHAADLAAILEKITGAKFAIATGDGQEGIAVGTVTDFPQAPVNGRLDPQDVMRGDEYIIKTHPKGVWLVGATEVAVGHAVWDFLYRLGYRQYFPGQNWEIVPACRELDAALDLFSAPDYVTRQIWYQWGTFKENESQYKDWCERNRLKSSFNLRNSHMYSDIVSQNKQEFEKHPEYYALVNGVRNGSKLCISNPGLRQLTSDYVLRWFKKNPSADSSSIEPTDGAGECECEACAKLGSISDRTVLLANEVAAALQAKYGTNKYLGMLAYFKHYNPPSIDVHPQVIVTVCTRFGSSDVSVNDAILGWKKRKAGKTGIYDYYSVHTWHRDLPGFPGGGNLPNVQGIQRFHKQGARYFSAESGDNWGPCGLGYFLASRLLWDISEAACIREIRSEFLSLCFNKAVKPMDEFYDLIDGGNRQTQLEDIVGQMYRLLNEGIKIETDAAVRARINDLVLYTRYVELYRVYDALRKAKSPRQKEFEELLKYAFRIRESGMVHTVALAQDLPAWDKEVTIPREAKISGSKDTGLWQNSAIPVSPDEIAQLLTEGISNNPVLSFKAIRYSTELVPAAKVLGLPQVPTGTYALHGTQSWFTWLEPGKQRLTVFGAGDFVYKLYAVDKEKGDFCVSEAQIKAPFDQANKLGGQSVELTSPMSGLHRVDVVGSNSWRLSQMPEATGDYHIIPTSANFNIPSSVYFYVPRGTRLVAGKTSDRGGVMKDDTGAPVFEFKQLKEEITKNKSAYFMVPVPKGRDGALWKMEGCTNRMLYTVPPYYARSAEELLLPREVVERDANRMK